MMPRIDTGPVTLSPASGGAVPADPRQAALQSALSGLVGQSLPAEVLSNFSDGSSLVKIAGLNVRLLLPPGIAVGSEVPLTVIAASPRATFQFGGGTASDPATLLYSETGAAPGGASAGAYGALASQDAPLPGAARPPPGSAPSAAPPNPAAPPGSAAAIIAGAAAQLIAAAPAQAAATAAADAAAATAAEAATPAGETAANAAAHPAGTAAGDPAANSAANSAANAATSAAPGASPASNPAANPPTGQTSNPAANPAAAPGGAAAAASTPTEVNAVLAAIAEAVAASAEADSAAPSGPAPGAPAATAAAEAQKAPGLAAALLGRAPLTPSSQLPDLNAGTPGAALSSTARALTIMLSAAQSLPGAAMVLSGKTPLVADGAPVPGQLAKMLQETISQSGLFYESHVGDWVKGDLSLSDLAREPQMQRMLEAAAAAPRPADAGPDLGAAQLVNLQLHTQEQARVQWNGQAWPGQNMQWDIRREQREGGRGDAEQGEPEQIWRSGVRFRFQMLGEVSAAVTIVGDQVHIQVVTDSAGAAATLRSYAGELETAMAAAGSPLSSLAIAADT